MIPAATISDPVLERRRLGRYEALVRLAQGGMASVYIGRSVGVAGFSRLVAIKVLHPHLAHEEQFISMFLDEARIAAAIRHPNVVATHDISEAEGLGYYLVMDYVEGGHLGSLMKAAFKQGEKHLPTDFLLRVFLDVLEGLEFAHDLQDDTGNVSSVVHRDVSPHNLLVGVDGIARVTDFGIAHARKRLTETRGGDFKGKIAYVSPEQALGKELDGRSDLFSLGIVLFEMLAGRRLQGRKSDLELLKGIIELKAPKLSAERPELAAFDGVIERALATDREERYGSATEMAAGLEEAAREAGIAPSSRKQVGAVVRKYLGESLTELRDRTANVMKVLGPLELIPSGTRPLPEGECASVETGVRPIEAEPTDVSAAISVELSDAPESPARSRWPWALALLVFGAIGGLGLWLAGQGTPAPSGTAGAEPPAATEDDVEGDVATSDATEDASSIEDVATSDATAEDVATENDATENAPTAASGTPTALSGAAVNARGRNTRRRSGGRRAQAPRASEPEEVTPVTTAPPAEVVPDVADNPYRRAQ